MSDIPNCTVVLNNCADLRHIGGKQGISIEDVPGEAAVYVRFNYGSASPDQPKKKLVVTTRFNGRTSIVEFPLTCVLRTLDNAGKPDYRANGISCCGAAPC